MAIIYKAKNKVNQKVYIGFTKKSLARRIWEHNNDALRTDRNNNTKFYNAIRKYGIDAFNFEILLESNDANFLLNHEENRLIKEYDSIKQGYNTCSGGQGKIGCIPWNKNGHHSIETREKIRLKAIGRKQTKETIRKRVEKTTGMKRSNDTKIKMAGLWGVQFPNGDKKEIINLSDFCKCNELTLSCMINVANGKRKHHKNFVCWRIKLSVQSRL
jgi:group I intron endonuclease